MKFFLLITVLCSFLSTSALYADEQTLSITDNDDNAEIYHLVVSVDESSQTLKKLFKDTYVNGKKIRRDVLNPNELNTDNGVILEKRDKHNVLNLKSDNFDYDRGGRIVIDTLYSGITGERRTTDLELAKDKNSWKLFKNKKAVSKFHVKVNKVIILEKIYGFLK
jgi:hypothetical protein